MSANTTFGLFSISLYRDVPGKEEDLSAAMAILQKFSRTNDKQWGCVFLKDKIL